MLAHVSSTPQLAHPGPRLALGASLLLHGATMAWVLQDAPPPPEAPAARVQVTLVEAPRPRIPPPSQPISVQPEVVETPAVAVQAPKEAARPEPVPEKILESKTTPVKRDTPPAPAERERRSEPAPPTVTKAEPTPPAVTAPGYEADYLNNPPPAYPRLSRRLREEGEVELRVRVSQTGQPETVELARSSGSERLDAAALRAVRQWRFEPARQGGRTVEAWVRVPIFFKLEA